MANILKCVVVGDGGVGKTSLLISFTTNTFPSDYVPTVFENYTAEVSVGETVHQVGLFDTAGQEEFDKLRPLAYPKTDVFLVCFCVCSFTSYKNVRDKWVPEIRQFCPTAPIVVVGTQLDRRVNPPTVSPYKANIISEDMGRKLSKELKAAFYHECSSLTREGVDRLFHDAIDLVVSKKRGKRKVHESCIVL